MRWRCTRTNRMAEATLYWAARHGTRERNAQRRGVERRENTWSTGWVGSGLVGSAGPAQGLTPRPPPDRPPVRPDSTRPPEMCSTAEFSRPDRRWRWCSRAPSPSQSASAARASRASSGPSVSIIGLKIISYYSVQCIESRRSHEEIYHFKSK